MPLWFDLISREAVYALLLLALGSGPAAALSERVDTAARFALAPMLGFCLGTCVATTVLYFVPAGDSKWMLVPLALASLAYAVRSGRVRAPGWRDAAQLAAVCLLVAGPLTWSLAHRESVGPAAFVYTDVNGYVASQDGAVHTSIRDATGHWEDMARDGERWADLTQWYWSFIAWFDSNLDAAPLNANVNALLGLGATETFSPFLVVLLLAGALGVYAAVRYATASETWLAVLGGALFSGAFFLELWFDSYQAAMIAIGLIVPIAVLAADTVRSRSRGSLIVLALALGAMLSVYSLFLPALGLIGALIVATLAFAARRRGEALRGVLVAAAALVVLPIVFNPVGFTRIWTYYRTLLDRELNLPRVPWTLPPDVLPGWLLQTRGFWAMPPLSTSDSKQLVLGALVPLVLIVAVCAGVRAYRLTAWLVALGAVLGLMAYQSYASQDACTYCAERLLLPLAPILALLVVLGLHAAGGSGRPWVRGLAVVALGVVVVSVAQRARIELIRFTNGSYFLDTASRHVLDRLPADARALHIEGFGQTTTAQAEQPLTYQLANERLRGRVSVSLASELNLATQYLNFGQPQPPGPEFHTDYSHVLTRFAGLRTGRQRVAREGAIALERRAEPLDVSPYAGLLVGMTRHDPTGVPRVQAGVPLRIHVVGEATGPAFVHLTFRAKVPFDVPRQPGVSSRREGELALVCVPVTGEGPVREATLTTAAALVPGPVPGGLFPPFMPPEGVTLVELAGVSGRCVP